MSEKIIDNTPITGYATDWGDPDGTGTKEKSLGAVQTFIKAKLQGNENGLGSAAARITALENRALTFAGITGNATDNTSLASALNGRIGKVSCTYAVDESSQLSTKAHGTGYTCLCKGDGKIYTSDGSAWDGGVLGLLGVLYIAESETYVYDTNKYVLISTDNAKTLNGHNENYFAKESDAAKKSGSYPNMSVGSASNLNGVDTVNATYLRRTSGGTADIGSGVAQIRSLKGNSYVWSQLYNDAAPTTNSGRKYVKSEVVISVVTRTYLTGDGNSVTYTADSTSRMLIDLTLMFGAGNEPATVEAFESWCAAQGIDLDKYYPYNEGEVINCKADAIQTVGFNQYNHSAGKANVIKGNVYQITGTYTKLVYDSIYTGATAYTYGSAVTENVYYSNNGSYYKATATAAAYDATATYAVGAYCINDSTLYKCTTAVETAETFDSSKWSAIADVAAMVTDGIFASAEIAVDSTYFTPAENGDVVVVGGNDVDTCVHLKWSGKKDGEFETYWAENHNLNLTAITGKVNGQGTSETIFPDGLVKVNNVADEIIVDSDGKARRAIKRFGKQSVTGAIGDTITLTGCKADTTNTICAKGALSAIGTLSGTTLTLTAAVTSLNVYFELATPVEYTLDAPLNMTYRVDDFGTETAMVLSSGSLVDADITKTAPLNYDVRYALNVVDTVRNLNRNYLGMTGAQNTFAAISSALAAYGMTMTLGTYDTTNEYYHVTISGGWKPASAAPASASATGTKGMYYIDTDYFYVCVDTNTWKRFALSTW